ncbi:MAG: transcriptional regulator [Nitratireductor sp.]
MKSLRNLALKSAFLCSIVLLSLNISANTLRAAELVMLEQDGCFYCERWHEEIGIAYPKTDEGKFAPLRVVNIHDEMPKDLENLRMEPFTPTFVLMNEGVEIGRLRGYTGDEFFWFLLNDLIKKIKTETDDT